jgi:ribosomal protein L37AE/L43A
VTAEPIVPQSVVPQPRSVFEPECPRCGAAMRPETGWIWTCPQCAFHAERVAGTLLEVPPDDAPSRAATTSSARDVTPHERPSLR